ncbi:MAG: DUF6320 domain-containing protein [Bacilli bacterium]|jgi:hypothetical protein|nr:DUF6320 domain-containing protein [Bacilli bacterium]MDY0064418.1 DUF6320 domain-containing protein [Bacilli bacterium]
MKKCPTCQVDVNSSRTTCPLCGEKLEGQGGQATHPPYQFEKQKINLALRILLFLSIIAISSTVLINFLTFHGDFWSFYVVLGILYMWILLRSTIMSNRNIAMRLLIQMISISLLCIGIEEVSRSSGWALEYIVPFTCIASTVAIVIVILSKKMRYNDYLLYLLTAILISFVPLILYWTEVVQILWPSIAAAGVAFITVVGMLLFSDRATKDELKKRFHI